MKKWLIIALILLLLLACGSEPAPTSAPTPTDITTDATAATTPTTRPEASPSTTSTPIPTVTSEPGLKPAPTSTAVPPVGLGQSIEGESYLSEEGRSRQETSGNTAGFGNARGGTFLSLLEVLPLNAADPGLVSFNDYERARDSHGIALPGDDASYDDLADYISALNSAGMIRGPWISGFSYAATEQIDQREHWSIGIEDMDQSIQVGEPSNSLEAVRGRFNPEATESALVRCSECLEPDRLEHLGVGYYSWGKDNEISMLNGWDPPAFDPLGRGGRIAVLESHVFRTLETPGMRSMIGTYLGREDSLADDPDMALAARELDGLEAYSVLLFDLDSRDSLHPEWEKQYTVESALEEHCETEEECIEVRARFEEVDALDKYKILGAGVGSDEAGPYLCLVFVYGDQGDAERNMSVLKDRLAKGVSEEHDLPWNELFPEAEVWSDGRTLTAKLRTEDPRMWIGILRSRDTILWYK